MMNTTKKKLNRYVVRQESPYDINEFTVLDSFDDEHTARQYCWEWNREAQPEYGTAVLIDTKTGKRNEHCYPTVPLGGKYIY